LIYKKEKHGNLKTKLHLSIPVFIILVMLFGTKSLAQNGSSFIIKNKAGYSNQDINMVVGAAERGIEALNITLHEIENIWDVNGNGSELWDQRMKNWNDRDFFREWLGQATSRKQIRLAYKRLHKIIKVSNRKRIFLVFQAPEKTFNCKWSKHAWTVPFGRVSIHFCPQFMFLSARHQSKAFVHEIGHESGILFHRKVYWRNAALRTARERPMKALRNPENYAYLVMEYYE
jgi:Lysine-specific metallo-endopeptidase